MIKYCDQCQAELIIPCDETESIGYQGAKAVDSGYVFKNSILYSSKSEYLFFCNDACCKQYYQEHGYQNKEVDKVMKEIKSKIPQMAVGTAEAMNKLVRNLKKMQKAKL